MKSENRLTKKEINRRIIHLFNIRSEDALSCKQVCAEIGITSQEKKKIVINLLENLFFGEFLVETNNGRYKLNGLGTTATGTFERRSNGKNSFIPETGGNHLFVAERNSMHAMNGDKVKVQILARRTGRTPEAEVIEIIERADNKFIGVLSINRNRAFLLTDSKILANDIYIPKNKLRGAKDGQKVVVKITEWPERANNPEGEIIDILGVAGDNTTEMHAILAEFGLPYGYPEKIEKAAAKIPVEIPEEEFRLREDFRDITTFTIDPEDAKDFDDALSIRKMTNGNWEVGVHIADVTYYVKPESIIDREAAHRATSVYLVDRTIPMLPESLSNSLCSLRPLEDKLCFSVIFEMNRNAEVKDYRIAKTVIRSNHRFTYEEVQRIIENKNLTAHDSVQTDFSHAILNLNLLAKNLREKRFKDGAINFERFEVKFEIDENGKPLRVYFKEAEDSNHLIEEFMLLANRYVAETIGKGAKAKKAKSFIYRVHDLPDPKKLSQFADFVCHFGHKLKSKGSNSEISKSLNHLLDKVQGRREQTLIETLAVRSMAKAIYTTKNTGHYGLAFKYYTHFTSPIRRYPDILVHRLLSRYLSGGRSVNKQALEKECKHCSDMETVASNAERTSIKYKQVEFMSDKIGMVFDGVISGVTEWGLYVELTENACEGLVPIRDLDDDYYEFDEKTYSLVGMRKKYRYRLGDSMKVKVVRANLERKQLDFSPVE